MCFRHGSALVHLNQKNKCCSWFKAFIGHQICDPSAKTCKIQRNYIIIWWRTPGQQWFCKGETQIIHYILSLKSNDIFFRVGSLIRLALVKINTQNSEVNHSFIKYRFIKTFVKNQWWSSEEWFMLFSHQPHFDSYNISCKQYHNTSRGNTSEMFHALVTDPPSALSRMSLSGFHWVKEIEKISEQI